MRTGRHGRLRPAGGGVHHCTDSARLAALLGGRQPRARRHRRHHQHRQRDFNPDAALAADELDRKPPGQPPVRRAETTLPEVAKQGDFTLVHGNAPTEPIWEYLYSEGGSSAGLSGAPGNASLRPRPATRRTSRPWPTRMPARPGFPVVQPARGRDRPTSRQKKLTRPC